MRGKESNNKICLSLLGRGLMLSLKLGESGHSTLLTFFFETVGAAAFVPDTPLEADFALARAVVPVTACVICKSISAQNPHPRLTFLGAPRLEAVVVFLAGDFLVVAVFLGVAFALVVVRAVVVFLVVVVFDPLALAVEVALVRGLATVFLVAAALGLVVAFGFATVLDFAAGLF
jgi:hypothetical protein